MTELSIADRVRLLHAQGLPQREIAVRLGITRGRVLSAIKHPGGKPGRPPKRRTCPHCGGVLAPGR